MVSSYPPKVGDDQNPRAGSPHENPAVWNFQKALEVLRWNFSAVGAEGKEKKGREEGSTPAATLNSPILPILGREKNFFSHAWVLQAANHGQMACLSFFLKVPRMMIGY